MGLVVEVKEGKLRVAWLTCCWCCFSVVGLVGLVVFIVEDVDSTVRDDALARSSASSFAKSMVLSIGEEGEDSEFIKES